MTFEGRHMADPAGREEAVSGEAGQAEKMKKMTLEEVFGRLGEITKKLEDPETDLEDSFALYKEGSVLLKEAESRISLVDRQVREMEEDGTVVNFS